MPTRRAFLRWSAAALTFGSGAVSRPPRILRIGTRLGAADIGFDRGIAFGVTEADRTGSLFGWRVERVAVDDALPPDVHAVVSTRPATGAFEAVPYMTLRCPAAPSPGTLTVARCDVPADVHPGSADRRIVSWHHSLERYGAAQLNDRYRAATSDDMTGEAWLGWIAVKMLSDAAMRARTSEPKALRAQLVDPDTHFDGHKGEALRFTKHGRLAHPVYEIARNESGHWTVVRQIAADVQS